MKRRFSFCEVEVEEDEDAEGVNGTIVWEAGLLFARWLQVNAEVVKGRRVLELGAGTGLVSLLLERLGAERVVATDKEPLVMELLRRNVEGSEVQALQLDWTEEDKVGPLLKNVDTVVGCDVVYNLEAAQQLADLALEHRHALFYVCFEDRDPIVTRAFLDTLREGGREPEVVSQEGIAQQHQFELLRIYKL